MRTIKLVNNILQQYKVPLTLRQIFYRLVANFDYPNKDSAYCQLSKQLVQARKDGFIDECMIEDRSREILGGDTGSHNMKEFLGNQISNFLNSPRIFSRKIWNNQAKFVIVWIEKDALSRVVSDVADKYRVMTAPSRGYASYTFIKQAIERFPLDKCTVVLHFADHDPSGLDMTRDLQKRLDNYSIDSLRIIEVERVALSYDQVIDYNLSPNPTKLADPRSEEYVAEFGNQCWELDAIDPDDLQIIVKEAITKHIDEKAWNQTIEEQELEREQLQIQFSAMAIEIKKTGLL